VDKVPKVLRIQRQTWRSKWVSRCVCILLNCLPVVQVNDYCDAATKEALANVSGKGKGSVGPLERVQGEPVEVDLPDLWQYGIILPANMIDHEWLKKHPAQGEARQRVDWGLAEAPDISKFLARINGDDCGEWEDPSEFDTMENVPMIGQAGSSSWSGAARTTHVPSTSAQVPKDAENVPMPSVDPPASTVSTSDPTQEPLQ
jgi:hypothetical protein